MTPKISIITATHRRPDLLYKCIKSVQTSTLQEYEHIIVGDHCDWAERVCDSFPFDDRIKYFERRENEIAYTSALDLIKLLVSMVFLN